MRLTGSVVRRVCCFSPGKHNIVQNVYNPHACKPAVLMGKLQCEVVDRGLSAATGAADRGANGTVLSFRDSTPLSMGVPRRSGMPS